MKRAACLVCLCALALGTIAAARADHLPQRVSLESAGWPLGDFSLTDHRGMPFTQDDLRGRWTLLLWGDSRCGAPCDAALSALAGLLRRIRETRAVQSVQVVMVSPDPDGEAPERLGRHLARFDPRFLGAHGSRTALQALAADLGAGASRSAGSIWVVGPDGILRSELLPPFDVALLTAEFMKTRARR